MLKFLLPSVFLLSSLAAQAQQRLPGTQPAGQTGADSVVIKVHPSYANVTAAHRWLFGKNYRAEWAAEVKLPVIRISEIHGGLIPVKEGGGMQSKSLRLANKQGKEWVIRSVEKTPDKLLPPNLQGTFAIDWIDDAMSAQHPFSALIVPPLAKAANVYHASPVIGVVAADPALGEYNDLFKGMVVLLEEREPAGNSDNTIKMVKELQEDNDNRFNAVHFLRARMLDLLIGDWDRHEDQWRWLDKKTGDIKIYEAVPRDRDQVFHVMQGVFPSLAKLPWIDPELGNFSSDIPQVKYSLFKTRFMKAFPNAHMSYETWMQTANDFVKAETDNVLEAGLQRLPKEIYRIRHDELLTTLKKRRDNIPEAMSSYYYFINKIVDIRVSDKNELVTITDGPEGGMKVLVRKINKSGELKDTLLNHNFKPAFTQQVRLYLGNGNDSVLLNNTSSKIKLRIVGGQGNKAYALQHSARKVHIYDRKDSVQFSGELSRFRRHLSNDTLNTKFQPTNLYNVLAPLATAAINADDGFLLGLGFRYVHKEGFRKLPYSSSQQLMLTHSFATSAFRLRYTGEWIQAVGKADFVLKTVVQAPDNTTNFFGRGNNSVLNKFDNYRTFYRTRYNTYEFDPSLRWHIGTQSTLNIGPSLQLYTMDREDNLGRVVNNPEIINSYDSLSLFNRKAHAGLVIDFNSNKRNNNILPSKGYYLSIVLEGYTGLNSVSKSYLQLRPEFTYYQKLNHKGSIVLSDRIGGGVTLGQPAFYQSMFLGGQGNLLGYLQNRFSGQHMVYNNFQARLKLGNIASYILPGQIGLSGFYDTGRVWIENEHSDKWHQGVGGGLYFSPAGLTIFQVLAGHSEEGWYPYVSLNFRI
jgi:hypothetical protein